MYRRRVPVFFGGADGRTVDVMGAGRPCARADLAPASSMSADIARYSSGGRRTIASRVHTETPPGVRPATPLGCCIVVSRARRRRAGIGRARDGGRRLGFSATVGMDRRRWKYLAAGRRAGSVGAQCRRAAGRVRRSVPLTHRLDADLVEKSVRGAPTSRR